MIEFEFIDVEIPGFNSEFFVLNLKRLIENERKVVGDLCIIFCSDDYLLDMNREHLNHDYYTDIITFDYCVDTSISGDLFISLDRVKDNANDFGVDWLEELLRVVYHGTLHLCGYKDKSNEESKVMRAKENYYLETTVSRETM
jgi:probable rRNA maturation factor